jgi:vitamin B12 transporter
MHGGRGYVLGAPLFLLALILPRERAAGEGTPVYAIDPIVVTASRVPTVFSRSLRSVSIIDSLAIEEAPAQSVHDLMELAGGVDVRKRGIFGVQADLSIRGGTFGQTLLLLDGSKVMDPQTNHHNTNLPLTSFDIERIEVLKGPGSRLYGPNAFGGVVNIITVPPSRERARLRAAGGQHGYYEGVLSCDPPVGWGLHHLTVSKTQSDGYRMNTDFDIRSVFYKGTLPLGAAEVTLSAGHIDNEFGANSFYVDPSKSKNEWERVQTTLINASSNFEGARVSMTPRLIARRNEDHYVFNRDDPGLYENLHTTWNVAGENSLVLHSRLGMTAVGMELGRESITSTRLDTLSRWKGGISIEQHLTAGKRWILVLGGFAYRYSDWGWQVWPGADIGYEFSAGGRLYCTLNRSFRVPTYTELYYISPSNVGDPELQPEEGWVYEIGARESFGPVSMQCSVFRREGTNIIDWTRPRGSTALWQAMMIGDLDMNGFESEARLDIRRMTVERIQADYTFLDSDKNLDGLESAYALANVRHQARLFLYQRWSRRLIQSWKLQYQKRSEERGRFLVDTRFAWKDGTVTLFAEASNVFDTPYDDLKALPLPGRWIRGGVELDLGGHAPHDT